jgi:hypothetical protein
VSGLLDRRLRMPPPTRAELYHRPLDTTLERLSDEMARE